MSAWTPPNQEGACNKETRIDGYIYRCEKMPHRKGTKHSKAGEEWSDD